MKIKTSELTGAALDWAVAKCEDVAVELHTVEMIKARRLRSLTEDEASSLPAPKPYLVIPGTGQAQYSTDWSQGGPIIEREGLLIRPQPGKEAWDSWKHGADNPCYTVGRTPLIAAMRCYVASKLGDEVEVPDELIGEQA